MRDVEILQSTVAETLRRARARTGIEPDTRCRTPRPHLRARSADPLGRILAATERQRSIGADLRVQLDEIRAERRRIEETTRQLQQQSESKARELELTAKGIDLMRQRRREVQDATTKERAELRGVVAKHREIALTVLEAHETIARISAKLRRAR